MPNYYGFAIQTYLLATRARFLELADRNVHDPDECVQVDVLAFLRNTLIAA
jgi:hypothetical protein